VSAYGGTLIWLAGGGGSIVLHRSIWRLVAQELMLNAVNINLVAFWRYITPQALTGQVFAVFVIGIAAAEAAAGLAIIISAYRRRRTVVLDELDTMHW
jgi:NADH-quinone oxidoreductase subunit K